MRPMCFILIVLSASLVARDYNFYTDGGRNTDESIVVTIMDTTL